MSGVSVARDGDWLSAMVGDELVMMNAVTGNYVTISRVGARIWELIEKPIGLGELLARLQQEFDVDEKTCRGDVEKFVNEMKTLGAVAIVAADAG